jgi:hypothetical protein
VKRTHEAPALIRPLWALDALRFPRVFPYLIAKDQTRAPATPIQSSRRSNRRIRSIMPFNPRPHLFSLRSALHQALKHIRLKLNAFTHQNPGNSEASQEAHYLVCPPVRPHVTQTAPQPVNGKPTDWLCLGPCGLPPGSQNTLFPPLQGTDTVWHQDAMAGAASPCSALTYRLPCLLAYTKYGMAVCLDKAKPKRYLERVQ